MSFSEGEGRYMNRFGKFRHLLSLAIIIGLLAGVIGSQIALAADATTPVANNLEITSRFPVKQGESGTSFQFDVSLNYTGTGTRVFDLSTNSIPGWQIYITQPFAEEGATQSVLATSLEPNLTYPSSLTVLLTPDPGTKPAPGDYLVTLVAQSGDVKGSIELKGTVTNVPLTYDFSFVTTTGRLDYPVKPGEGVPIQTRLTNTGTGPITNFSFTSVKSEGWAITFTPNKIGVLEPGQSQEVEVMMTPPKKTISGDYRVLVRSSGNSPSMNLQEQVDLRTRVETPSIWGGVGIGIVVAVVAGLAAMFRQLGRR
jgi:uncharacterized membrane protein